MPDVSRVAEPCRDHPEEIAGRYRLGPVLRRSPGCCSHRATDRLLRRTVSVTLVDDAGRDGLDLPEQSWHRRSPEVAEIYDGGTWRGRLFLVTQHPDAPTLAETTPPAGLPVAEVRDLGLAVATALLPLHRRGRSHGGLGAGTVSWSARGAALSDVGLLPWLAQWSDVRLAPPFPAPELGREGHAAAPADDVYALGRLLDELAPRRVPRAVRGLLTEMTAPVPALRPGTEDVMERLRALPVPSGRRAGTAGAVGAHGRRAAVVVAAAVLLGSGVGLGAFVNASGTGSSAAFASAAGGTRVPGVPLPPAAAVPPPLPAPAAVEPPAASPASGVEAMRRAFGVGGGMPAVATEDSSDGTPATPRRSADPSRTPTADRTDDGSGTRTDPDDRATDPDDGRADDRMSPDRAGRGSGTDDGADEDRDSGKDGGSGKDRSSGSSGSDSSGSDSSRSGPADRSGTSRSGKDRTVLPLGRLVKGITDRAGDGSGSRDSAA